MEQSEGIACRTASGKWELMKDPKVKIENGMMIRFNINIFNVRPYLNSIRSKDDIFRMY